MFIPVLQQVLRAKSEVSSCVCVY